MSDTVLVALISAVFSAITAITVAIINKKATNIKKIGDNSSHDDTSQPIPQKPTPDTSKDRFGQKKNEMIIIIIGCFLIVFSPLSFILSENRIDEINNKLADAKNIIINSNSLKNTSAPVGTIVGYTGDMSQENKDYLNQLGWLFCDGRHLSKTEYKELYERIGGAWGLSQTTFDLPDLQGVFLRGVSGDSNRDPEANNRTSLHVGANEGNKVGSYQEDKFQGHKHKETSHSHKVPGVANNKEDLAKGNNWGAPGKGSTETSTASCKIEEPVKLDEVNGTPRYGQETRPKNVYVYWIIKYREDIKEDNPK